jgi:protoporphyrinogen oxidase
MTRSEHNVTLIIGAGLTGLTAAFHLQRPYVLVDSEEAVGGLARSSTTRGFTFDQTGHWLHMRDPWTKGFVQDTVGCKLVSIVRKAAIFSYGVRTPYPYQAHTFGLPLEVVADCVLGFFTAHERLIDGKAKEIHSFGDHIRNQLGDGIARHFMIPYNTKLWTVHPDEMSAKWCQRFVPQPTPQEVVWGALRLEGAGHLIGYNQNFWYPAEGGIGTLPQAIHSALPSAARCSERIVTIDWRARTARTASGTTIAYASIVSTMPLTELVAALAEPPEQVRTAAQRLRRASVTYWNLAFAGADKDDAPQWTYFPEQSFPFYRMGSPTAALTSLAPPKHRSYWVEISHAPDAAASLEPQQLLDALVRAHVSAQGEEPVLCERHTIATAYVIMNHDYAKARDEILDWLRAQGILSTGRYGAWTYDSMEDALLAGRDAATWVHDYEAQHANG